MSKPIGRGVVVASVLVAIVILGLAMVPRILNHDAATLPDHLRICDRDYSKDILMRQSTLAEIRTRDGVEPVVVDAGLFPSCTPGACTAVAQDVPCATVIYVRVGEDAYLDYELQGGP